MNHSMPYHTIDSFFDCYGFKSALALLGSTIKTADTKKIWKGDCPANLLYFTDRLMQLTEAAFAIAEKYDYLQEAIINNDNGDLWFLAQYKSYCSWHLHSTPWDFFPRHLSRKEFLNPYRAIEKFTVWRTLAQWKAILKNILEHALSPHYLPKFDNGASILPAWLHLHKLIEAAHLIYVRLRPHQERDRFNREDSDSHLPSEDQPIVNSQHV